MRQLWSYEENQHYIDSLPVEERYVQPPHTIYIHEDCIINGIIGIDIGILDQLRKLWLYGIETFMSCQGGPIDMDDWELHPQDISPESDSFYVHDNQVYEYAFVIIKQNDLEKATQLLPPKFRHLQDHGYGNVPEDTTRCYWKPINFDIGGCNETNKN